MARSGAGQLIFPYGILVFYRFFGMKINKNHARDLYKRTGKTLYECLMRAEPIRDMIGKGISEAYHRRLKASVLVGFVFGLTP